jgi:CMP-N,N'-diacetyllegionaminic acid synthase
MGAGSVLAVITARGGSKRMPGKNIRQLAGKPLIAWTIEAARACGDCLYAVVVSTDDEAIARVSQEHGAEVPFMRPEALATDKAASLPVVQHATQFIERRDGITFDWVLLLQPTSPLRKAEDIMAALTIAQAGDCDSVVSVKPMPVHPVFAKTMDADGVLHPFLLEEPEGLRRQDVSPPAYCRNGAIYLTRRTVLMENNSLYGKRTRAIEMPEDRSVDIDTPLDFALAELLISSSRIGPG